VSLPLPDRQKTIFRPSTVAISLFCCFVLVSVQNFLVRGGGAKIAARALALCLH
jgi:hypothetical protein